MRVAGWRWLAALLGMVTVATGCADSHFRADAEDARRLKVLHADELVTHLAVSTTCTETAAVYRPSTGEPLDFAAVVENTVDCSRPPPASDEEFLAAVSAATAAGWMPSIEGGQSGSFRFRKRFGDVWASARLTSQFGLGAVLTIPPHTTTGTAPGPAEVTAGRACLAEVTAGQPATSPACLQR